jgi:LysM repeat protein
VNPFFHHPGLRKACGAELELELELELGCVSEIHFHSRGRTGVPKASWFSVRAVCTKDIQREMALIAKGIQDAFAGMGDVGTKLGEDLIQSAIDKLNKEKARLINLANEIAASIAAAMASAAAAIGVGGVTSSVTLNPTTETTPTPDTTYTAPNNEGGTTTTPFDTGTTPKAPATTKTPSLAAAEKYIVKSGDTLSAIAKANDTTLKAILAANPKFTDVAKYQGGNMIWSGTTVNIPAPKVAAPATTYGGFSNDAQNTAKYNSTTIEKGAVTVNMASNIAPADVEPAITRALISAYSFRDR